MDRDSGCKCGKREPASKNNLITLGAVSVPAAMHVVERKKDVTNIKIWGGK